LIERVRRALQVPLTRRVVFEIDLVPLVSERLGSRTIANWFLTESSVHLKPSRPWGLPTVIQVEPTSRCNVHCAVCPAAGGMSRVAGDMDVELFERLVAELAGTVLVMLFWDWGEPFLHPEACHLIHLARSAGIRVVSSTNGLIFADSDRARDVVASGLDVLTFSVDGATQESYRRFRTAGDLERVLEGVRRVAEEKRRRRSSTPLVNFRFIVMRHNEHELGEIEAVARSVGADLLTIRKFHAAPDSGGRLDGAVAELAPSDLRHQLPALSSPNGRPRRVRRNPCRNLWNCPTIHWDGTVCSCFADFDEQRPLGTLRERSFREIWYGEAYGRLRRSFRRSWRELPLCGACSYGWVGGDIGLEANTERIWLTPRREAR
jgi:MoaA/NifB/PqqE/SkfB family radical SAM enzyme